MFVRRVGYDKQDVYCAIPSLVRLGWLMFLGLLFLHIHVHVHTCTCTEHGFQTPYCSFHARIMMY